jgi:hypothetical protein
MPDEPQFAIVPLPDGPHPADAIAVGGMNAIMERVIDSKVRIEAEEFVRRVGDAVEQARELEERQAIQRNDAIQRLCDGIAQMARRLDQYEQRSTLQREVDATAQEIIDTYAIPDGMPDPDANAVGMAPEGDYPQPTLTPDPWAEDSVLPKALQEPGTEMTLDPEDLAHPQKPQQQPTAIDI